MPHNPAACSSLNPTSIAKSYNQVAKRGVSIFGALSAFESQPPESDFLGLRPKPSSGKVAARGP